MFEREYPSIHSLFVEIFPVLEKLLVFGWKYLNVMSTYFLNPNFLYHSSNNADVNNSSSLEKVVFCTSYQKCPENVKNPWSEVDEAHAHEMILDPCCCCCCWWSSLWTWHNNWLFNDMADVVVGASINIYLCLLSLPICFKCPFPSRWWPNQSKCKYYW